MLPAVNGAASVLYLTEIFQKTADPRRLLAETSTSASARPSAGSTGTGTPLTTEEEDATSVNPISTVTVSTGTNGSRPLVETTSQAGGRSTVPPVPPKVSRASMIISAVGPEIVLASLVFSATLIAYMSLSS